MPTTTNRPVGVNTAIGPYYYSDSYGATDAYKIANDWNADYGSDNAQISMDADDRLTLPAGMSARCFMWNSSSNYPLGTYVVTFEGDGDFNIEGQTFLAPPGRFEFQVASRASNGLVLHCTRSNPANKVKITHVWNPGYEGSASSWTDEYIGRTSHFSILRFLQDQNIIQGEYEHWSERALPSRRWVGAAGVPIEALCELSNKAGAHAWFCVPLKADDEYVREMARLVLAELDPSLKVYVEYYCEMWNWVFPGSQYQVGRHAPDGITDPGDNDFYGQTDWYSWRSRQIFAIWEEEWAAHRSRLVTVIAGQAGWPERGRKLLQWASRFNGGGPPCDAYADAPYFYPSPGFAGGDAVLGDPSSTLDELFADLAAEDFQAVRTAGALAKQYADEFGVPLVAYEAGQHLRSSDSTSNNLYIAANRDPRMYGLYLAYMDLLVELGYEAFNLYQQLGRYSYYGSWGLEEAAGLPLEGSPKLRAALDWIEANGGGPGPDPEPHTPVRYFAVLRG